MALSPRVDTGHTTMYMYILALFGCTCHSIIIKPSILCCAVNIIVVPFHDVFGPNIKTMYMNTTFMYMSHKYICTTHIQICIHTSIQHTYKVHVLYTCAKVCMPLQYMYLSIQYTVHPLHMHVCPHCTHVQWTCTCICSMWSPSL